MLTRSDFRLRKVPAGYRISQRVGSGWELLADVYPSRREAEGFVASVTGFRICQTDDGYRVPPAVGDGFDLLAPFPTRQDAENFINRAVGI